MKYILLIATAFNFVYIESKFVKSIKDYYVNFDISMGKDDQFFRKYYQMYFSLLHYTNENLGNDPFAADIKCWSAKYYNLYKKNNIASNLPANNPKIPLIVHQIWLGSPLPKKFNKWVKTWQFMGRQWKYKLWTDHNVKKLKLVNQVLFDLEKNYGAKSDILRIEILYQFGGVYADIDFQCLNPSMFEVLNHYYDFYIGLHPLDLLKYYQFGVVNALIASVPGHPVLKGYIDELPNQYDPKNFHGVPFRTGPHFFNKMFFKYTNKMFKDIVFPPSFFYPLGYDQIKELSPEEKNKKQFVKPESIAIHWWGSSWY